MKYFCNFGEGLFNCKPYRVLIFKNFSATQILREMKKTVILCVEGPTKCQFKDSKMVIIDFT